MKTLMSLVLICGLPVLTAVGSGQDFEISEPPPMIWKWDVDTNFIDLEVSLQDSNWSVSFFDDKVYRDFVLKTFLIEYEQYEAECLTDTIKAIKHEHGYIIDFEGGILKEMVTEKQLEDRGYEYKYRWVIKTDPFEFEYIWIKKQTLPGFMEWLKEREYESN